MQPKSEHTSPNRCLRGRVASIISLFKISFVAHMMVSFPRTHDPLQAASTTPEGDRRLRRLRGFVDTKYHFGDTIIVIKKLQPKATVHPPAIVKITAVSDNYCVVSCEECR
jgi:hypothetical protein